jgi:uncharacterized membrane protein
LWVVWLHILELFWRVGGLVLIWSDVEKSNFKEGDEALMKHLTCEIVYRVNTILNSRCDQEKVHVMSTRYFPL